MEKKSLENREFFPERVPARGEIYAWIFALIVTITWIILKTYQQGFALWAGVLAVLLILSAGSISLSNWMDRSTKIGITGEGITFRNGLRNVNLQWEDIQSLKVFPSRFGAQEVQVIGNEAHFEFRTLGEVRYNGEVRGRTGFENGDQILKTILDAARLKNMNALDATPKGYYYTRE